MAKVYEQLATYHSRLGDQSKALAYEKRARDLEGEFVLPEGTGKKGFDAGKAAQDAQRQQAGPSPIDEEEPTLSPESRELGSILEASRLITASLDLTSVLARIMDITMMSLGAERGFFMLRKGWAARAENTESAGTDSSLEVVLARNMDRQALDERGLSVSRTIIREVEKTGGAAVVTDARTDERFNGSESIELQALRSILCVPLMDQGAPIGLLYLDNHLVSHLFTDQDLSFLKTLASFAVIAIRNARTYDEIRRQRDEIEGLKERLQEEIVYLKEELHTEHTFDEIVGASQAMQEVFRFIERAPPLAQPVLIQGETGTGKELVARAIHRRSPRADKPIIKVNCAAIPEGLLESELFGHEKGAFTGAVRRKLGRFELAAGGILFLDEIGEMSPALQAKLLRALEDKEFERVGGTQTLKVDIRVIAATNRDLAGEIKGGGFREDLYYRLNVLPVLLPPLRERTGDIPRLIAHFIERLNRKYDTKVRDVDRVSLETAARYKWPGNVRELANLVERAIALSDSPHLKLAHLLPVEKNDGAAPGDGEPHPLAGGYFSSVEVYKKRLIEEAIRRAGGSKKEAARLLGMSPSYLSRLIKSLDVGG